jgi:DNA-binding GntR family transcriptional regulator
MKAAQSRHTNAQDEKLAPLPITKEVLRDKVYHLLREWIINGALKPGERIVESVLASRMQVSRAPFREALWLLASEGLVRLEAHQSAFVTQLSREDLEQIFEVRELLEIHAAKRLHAHLSPEKSAELEQALAALREAARRRDVQGFSEADREFHRTLGRLAGNRYLEQMLNGVCTVFFAYQVIRDVTSAQDFRFDEVAQEHEEMVKLIQRGPEKAIEKGFRNKFRSFEAYVLERFNP